MTFKGLNKRIAVIALVLVVALLSQFFVDVTVSDAQPVVRIAMAQSASVEDADYVCDGEDDDIQWQLAVNAVLGGGKVEDLCGCTYNFGNAVDIPSSDITIRGIGGQTHFTRDASSVIFDAASYSRCLFQDFRTDGGNITHSTANDSYIQNVWIGSNYYFEGPEGSAGGGGNVTREDVEDWSGAMWSSNTETRATVTYQDADGTLDIVVDNMNDDVPESGDFGAAGDLDADGTITDGVIDEADLDCDNAPTDEYVLTYESDTGNYAWQQDQGVGDSVSVDGGATVDPDFVSTDDIDFINTANTITAAIMNDTIVAGDFANADWGDITITSNVASVEDDSHNHTTTTVSGLDISADTNLAAGTGATLTDDTISVDLGTSIETGEITDGTVAEVDLDVANAPTDEYVLTWEVGSGQFEWEQTAGDDMGSVDTEAELESTLTDVSDVFTDNDGALTDDDVSLADVQTATTSDFHNIGGTDDDVPESGDFGAAGDLDADGTITDGVIDEADLDAGNAPTDEYVLTYESDDGRFYWEADVGGAGGGGDDVLVDGGNVTDPDFVSTGDIDFVDVANTVSANINEDVILIGDVADGDWGDFSVSSNVATLDAGVVSDNEIDYSQVTFEDFDYQSAWEVYYSNGSGDVTALSIGANNTVFTSNGISAIPEWRVISGDDMGSVDTEAELESALTDVSDVFTDNDGALDDDDVSLADVQSACTNDFHNIGGVDDERTQEEIEDFVGAMLSGNTETRITVSYQDGDGTIDFIVDDLDTTLTQEEVEDYIGGLVNDPDSVQTRITVTYDDADNAIDFIVDDLDTTLTQEEVDDYVYALINDADSTHTRVTITYDDADNAYDFVVDDMNDDVPESGDFGNAADLDADGEVADDSHNHTTTTVSGLDISADTNLAAGTGATLTDDTISVDLGTSIETGEITDDEILEADLDATNAPTDNYYLTYDLATGGFTWVASADTTLSQEEVDDYVDALINDGDAVHTRITITYDDADDAMDFVVDDMNDDVPESGDFGNAADLDADGSVSADAVALGTDTTGNYVETVVAGSYVDITGADGEGSTKTVAVDPTEFGNTTWLDGTLAVYRWTWNLSGTDVHFDFGGGYIDAIAELRENGNAVYTTADGSLEGTTAGDFLTLTGVDIDHDPVDRYWQIKGCSFTGNETYPKGDCADITFGGFTTSVSLWQLNDIGGFYFKTPEDWGFGGNTTTSVYIDWRTEDATTGSVTFQARAATTIAGLLAASWDSFTADSWTQNNEVHTTPANNITVSGISQQVVQGFYIEIRLSAETLDNTADGAYIDLVYGEWNGV